MGKSGRTRAEARRPRARCEAAGASTAPPSCGDGPGRRTCYLFVLRPSQTSVPLVITPPSEGGCCLHPAEGDSEHREPERRPCGRVVPRGSSKDPSRPISWDGAGAWTLRQPRESSRSYRTRRAGRPPLLPAARAAAGTEPGAETSARPTTGRRFQRGCETREAAARGRRWRRSRVAGDASRAVGSRPRGGRGRRRTAEAAEQRRDRL